MSDAVAGLLACPTCDLLHEYKVITPGQKARCRRCHTVLLAPKTQSLDVPIALAITTAILMIGAVSFPFLSMSSAGLGHSTSILQIIWVFSEGWMVIVGAAVALLVVVLPVFRALALVYTMLPLRLGRPALPYARNVFLMAQSLRPWAMTEVFIVGTVVALIKVTGLASTTFGLSFWVYCALVLVIAIKDSTVCKWTIWTLLATSEKA